MNIAVAILNLFALGVAAWSAWRAQKQFAALPAEQIRVMRQAGSVAFWFCQGGALFFVVYGVRIFGVVGYQLAIFIWSIAAVFCVCGFWVRYALPRQRCRDDR